MARSILAAAAIFIFFTAESARNWSSNRELWCKLKCYTTEAPPEARNVCFLLLKSLLSTEDRIGDANYCEMEVHKKKANEFEKTTTEVTPSNTWELVTNYSRQIISTSTVTVTTDDTSVEVTDRAAGKIIIHLPEENVASDTHLSLVVGLILVVSFLLLLLIGSVLYRTRKFAKKGSEPILISVESNKFVK